MYFSYLIQTLFYFSFCFSAKSSAHYTLDVYPSEVYFNEYQSNTPTVVAVSLVAVVCVVAALFLLYDMLVSREMRKMKKQQDRLKSVFAKRMERSSIRNLVVADGGSDGKKSISPEGLQKIFDELDKDGGGTIDW